MLQLCPNCRGTGKVDHIAEGIQYCAYEKNCPMCKGTKLISQEKQVNRQRRRKVNRVLEEELEKHYPYTSDIGRYTQTRRNDFKDGYDFGRKKLIQLSEDLADQNNCMMGIGDGSGQLFVHGNYESIKHLQSRLDRLRELERKEQLVEEFYENFKKT